MAHKLDQAADNEAQGKSDRLGQRTKRDRKCEEKKRKETGAEKCRTPGEAHQAIDAREEAEDGNARLLDGVASQMKQQTEANEQQTRGPGLERQGQQLLALPP